MLPTRRLDLGVLLAVSVAMGAAGPAQARTVYVSLGNGISQYSASSSTGALRPLSPFRLGPRNSLNGIAIPPDGRSLYVANSFNTGAIGPDRPDHTIVQFNVDRATGRLRPKRPMLVRAGTAPSGLVVNRVGGRLYASNTLSDDVSQFAIGAGGLLTPLDPPAVAAGESPADLALAPNGRWLYVTNFNANTISAYEVAAGGRLIPHAGPSTSVPQPAGIALARNGRSLYVTVLGGVAQFDVDPATGALTPKARPLVALSPGPFPIAVAANGRSAYVGFQNGVAYFAIDPGTGALTRRGTVGVPGARFPAVSALAATGRNLYGTFQGGRDGGVVQYSLDASGRPSPLRNATPRSGFAPNDVAVG